MNAQLEELLQLPKPHKLAILGGAVGLVLLIYYFLVLSPLAEDVSKLEDSIYGSAGLKEQIEIEEQRARNLPKFEKIVARLDGELRRALLELPDRKQIDDLLTRISNKAKEAGLEIQVFKPLPEQKRDFYAEVPVDVQVAGSYHQLGTFFDEVGHLERIVNLDSYQLTAPRMQNGSTLLTTKVVATAFRFLEEHERPKAEKGKTGKRRRRR